MDITLSQWGLTYPYGITVRVRIKVRVKVDGTDKGTKRVRALGMGEGTTLYFRKVYTLYVCT